MKIACLCFAAFSAVSLRTHCWLLMNVNRWATGLSLGETAPSSRSRVVKEAVYLFPVEFRGSIASKVLQNWAIEQTGIARIEVGQS